MNQPLFSILIPVYNVENYIDECIHSVLEQECENYEVIIIDDGSTDNSGIICDRYADKYENIHVYHQQNKGLMLTRKAGIEKARGEYCLFLDGDDYYDKRLLSEMEQYILNEKGLDLVLFNLCKKYVNREIYAPISQGEVQAIDKKAILHKFLVSNKINPVVTKVIKRSVIEKYLDIIYIPVNYFEDGLQTAYFIILSKKIGILDKPYYYYRMRKDSLVHQKKITPALEIPKVSQRILDYLEKEIVLHEEEKGAFIAKNLNDFMESVYHYNQSSVPYRERKKELSGLMQNSFVKGILQEKYIKKIVIYNQIRAVILKKERYRVLLTVDRFLFAVQKVLNILENKQFYGESVR